MSILEAKYDLKSILERLGGVLERLGDVLGHLGGDLVRPRSFLCHLARVLGASWGPLWRSREPVKSYSDRRVFPDAGVYGSGTPQSQPSSRKRP